MRKALYLAMVALAALTMMAGTAFAEGYNDGGYNYTTDVDEPGYGDNAGIYVRQPEGSNQTTSAQGPHGGYNVSTNKCQDCHSTHYALGAFVLMRSDTREDACTFCHQGGGGSTVNIMMDNEYDANGVVTTSTTGFGTGHTLGYQGSAPADINPAFTEEDGLACFSCHTPHGNSARVVATPANPGASIDVFDDDGAGNPILGVAAPYNGVVTEVRLNHGGRDTVSEAQFLITEGPLAGYYDLNKPSQSAFAALCVLPASAAQKTARWGISPFAQNMVFRRGTLNPLTGGVADTHAITRPIFKQGKWLLIKNPNVKTAEETITVYNWVNTGNAPIVWGTSRWPDYNSDTLPNDGPPTRPLRGAILTIYPGQEVPNTAVGFRFWTGVNPTTINPNYYAAGYAAGDVALNVDAAAWLGFARPGTPKGLLNTTAAPKRDSARIYLKGGPYTAAEIAAIPAGDPRWATSADDGVNKYAMDWANALGPADQMSLDEQESDRNQAYPFTASPANTGFGSVNEMCVDCHSGAAGASTQKANVFMPDYSGGGSYQIAYSHDAQPRH